MFRFRRAAVVAVAAGTALAAFTGVGSAAAAPPPLLKVVKTFDDDFVGPLQFSVDGHRITVADSARSQLFRLGSSTPIASGPPATQDPEASGSLDGVDAKYGTVAYTTTTADHQHTYLKVLRNGKLILKANLARYEKVRNPDGGVYYGVPKGTTVSPDCAAALQAGTGQAPRYRGAVDSHPYAVAALPDHSWLVADAGGNDIVRVDRWGHISTVAVLPRQSVVIDDAAIAAGAPAVCKGITYRFEAVPTDVEVSPHGVFVSTLPGGAGAAGSVYRIGWHGRVSRVATGFVSATNLAVTPSGRIFVAELFAGRVSEIRHGAPVEVAELPAVAALEWSCGKLYAATAPAVTGGSGPGKVVILG